MSREVMQQMLSALETLMLLEDEDCGVEKCRECQALRPVWAAMKAGKEALDAPEPEQVALMDAPLLLNGQPLYTRPLREWQGLTEDEVDDIWNRYCDEMGEASINDAQDIANAIEKAMKEKNT